MVRGGEGPAAATPLIMHTVVAASVVSKETSPVVNPHRVIVARYAGARGEAEGDWFDGIGLEFICRPSAADNISFRQSESRVVTMNISWPLGHAPLGAMPHAPLAAHQDRGGRDVEVQVAHRALRHHIVGSLVRRSSILSLTVASASAEILVTPVSTVVATGRRSVLVVRCRWST